MSRDSKILNELDQLIEQGAIKALEREHLMPTLADITDKDKQKARLYNALREMLDHATEEDLEAVCRAAVNCDLTTAVAGAALAEAVTDLHMARARARKRQAAKPAALPPLTVFEDFRKAGRKGGNEA